MSKVKRILLLWAVGAVFLAGWASAGVPLTNLEGVGGIAFNPLAYPANSGSSLGDPNSTFGKLFGRPQIGGWYVHLPEANADWTSFGLAESFAKRLEVSYAHETVAIQGLDNITKDDFGAKLLLIPENSWDTKWVPAVSAGIIGKHTSELGQLGNGVDSTGYDYYLVATKLITQTPVPVLLSGGLLSTNSRTTGVLGYDDDRDNATFFGNIDIIPFQDWAFGIEYKQGAQFSDFKNADYFDVHAAWMATKNLTLVAAYVNAGDTGSGTAVGLGDGLVLSAQYAF